MDHALPRRGHARVGSRVVPDRRTARASRSDRGPPRDEGGIVLGHADDHETRRTWNVTDEGERAEHRLQLRSPRPGDEAEAIDARQKTRVEAVGSGAQIEDHGRAAADRVDDLGRAIDIQAAAQSGGAREEWNGGPT